MSTFQTTDKATIAIFFKNIPKVFKVYDSNGMLYFFRNTEGQKRLKFNVAKADTFTINCQPDTLEILPLSVHLLKTNLPAPDRSEIKAYTIIYNPLLKGTPARNFYKKGLIEYGDVFLKQPYPVRVFILLHEVGHFYYSSEDNADVYAAQEFIKAGYNNSTAFYSLKNVLNFDSKRNRERLINLFKNLHR